MSGRHQIRARVHVFVADFLLLTSCVRVLGCASNRTLNITSTYRVQKARKSVKRIKLSTPYLGPQPDQLLQSLSLIHI